jgi:hypothetical protein
VHFASPQGTRVKYEQLEKERIDPPSEAAGAGQFMQTGFFNI